MSVELYLKNLVSAMLLSKEEKSSITTSIDALKQRIDWCFSDVLSVSIFESCERNTISPRKYDFNSDIDVMIKFYNPNKYNPQSFFE